VLAVGERPAANGVKLGVTSTGKRVATERVSFGKTTPPFGWKGVWVGMPSAET
jgi:hypothetical protein